MASMPNCLLTSSPRPTLLRCRYGVHISPSPASNLPTCPSSTPTNPDPSPFLHPCSALKSITDTCGVSPWCLRHSSLPLLHSRAVVEAHADPPQRGGSTTHMSKPNPYRTPKLWEVWWKTTRARRMSHIAFRLGDQLVLCRGDKW